MLGLCDSLPPPHLSSGAHARVGALGKKMLSDMLMGYSTTRAEMLGSNNSNTLITKSV